MTRFLHPKFCKWILISQTISTTENIEILFLSSKLDSRLEFSSSKNYSLLKGFRMEFHSVDDVFMVSVGTVNSFRTFRREPFPVNQL